MITTNIVQLRLVYFVFYLSQFGLNQQMIFNHNCYQYYTIEIELIFILSHNFILIHKSFEIYMTTTISITIVINSAIETRLIFDKITFVSSSHKLSHLHQIHFFF